MWRNKCTECFCKHALYWRSSFRFALEKNLIDSLTMFVDQSPGKMICVKLVSIATDSLSWSSVYIEHWPTHCKIEIVDEFPLTTNFTLVNLGIATTIAWSTTTIHHHCNTYNKLLFIFFLLLTLSLQDPPEKLRVVFIFVRSDNIVPAVMLTTPLFIYATLNWKLPWHLRSFMKLPGSSRYWCFSWCTRRHYYIKWICNETFFLPLHKNPSTNHFRTKQTIHNQFHAISS